jgi:hypothetical protein
MRSGVRTAIGRDNALRACATPEITLKSTPSAKNAPGFRSEDEAQQE